MSTSEVLIKELFGSQCRCGSIKRSGETFCKKCYFTLTRDLRSQLYKLMGDGYEESYQEAVKFLDSKAVL